MPGDAVCWLMVGWATKMRELSPSGVCPRTKTMRRRRPRPRGLGAWRSSRLPHKRTRPCLLAKLAGSQQRPRPREGASPGEGAARRRGVAGRGGVAGRRGASASRRRPCVVAAAASRHFFWGRKGIRECCGCVDDFGTARVRGKWPARFDIGLKFWPRQRGKDATAKSVTDI